METVVKGLLIALVVVVMYQCDKDNEFEITDDKFLNALIEQGFDTNGDGFNGTEGHVHIHTQAPAGLGGDDHPGGRGLEGDIDRDGRGGIEVVL